MKGNSCFGWPNGKIVQIFVLSLALLLLDHVFFSTESFAEDSSTHEIESNLNSIIEAMGYIDIEIDQCTLRFSRNIVPDESNNRANKYIRTLHLETIDWGIEPTLSELDLSPLYRYYSLEFTTLKSYYEIYRESIFFMLWARREYPLANWPYEHPKFHDQFTSVLEIHAEQMIADFEKLNSWTDFSSFGRSTSFSQNFEIGFGTEGPLISFAQALQRYSQAKRCDS